MVYAALHWFISLVMVSQNEKNHVLDGLITVHDAVETTKVVKIRNNMEAMGFCYARSVVSNLGRSQTFRYS